MDKTNKQINKTKKSRLNRRRGGEVFIEEHSRAWGPWRKVDSLLRGTVRRLEVEDHSWPQRDFTLDQLHFRSLCPTAVISVPVT